MVDNCTYGTIAFPLYKDFPGCCIIDPKIVWTDQLENIGDLKYDPLKYEPSKDQISDAPNLNGVVNVISRGKVLLLFIKRLMLLGPVQMTLL